MKTAEEKMGKGEREPMPPPGPLSPLPLRRPQARFIDIAEHGGHWCRRCWRYVEVEQSDTGQPDQCATCGSIRLRWDPPVPGFQRDENQLKSDPKNCHV